ESERWMATVLPRPQTSLRPAINPDLGGRRVSLHQLGAQLDGGGLFMRQLETHPPTPGHRIGLGHNVADISLIGADDAAHGGRIDGLQLFTDEVQDKPARTVRSGADPGLRELRKRWRIYLSSSPVHPVYERVFALSLQPLLGTPKGDNIVVDLFFGRDLDDMNGTFPPVANGFH